MSDRRATLTPWAIALDQRAAALARLLESHPARHLLAEYEAVFLDRRPCHADRDEGQAERADRLLARMDTAIAELERAAASAGR